MSDTCPAKNGKKHGFSGITFILSPKMENDGWISIGNSAIADRLVWVRGRSDPRAGHLFGRNWKNHSFLGITFFLSFQM